MEADPIIIAAEAAFEIERLQIMAQGKRLPKDNLSRNIFNIGFSAGALWCLRELRTAEQKLKEALDGSEQSPQVAARLPMPRVPVASLPSPGDELLNELARAKPGPAKEYVPLAARNPRAATRGRFRSRPLQPRRPR